MPDINTNSITPGTADRITILDSLRGIAVLGILIMNIPFFGLPDPAGYNPVAMNEIGTINEKIYIIVNGYLDGTQRAIFSMLFGAGILLFVSRLEKRLKGIRPAEYFIRRQLWLIVFGLFNAYILLWPGDILFPYGICGIIMFVFRKLSVKFLILAAGICLLLMTVRENVDLYRKKEKIEIGERVALQDSLKTTEEEKANLEEMRKMKELHTPESVRSEMKTVLKKMKGSYADAYHYFNGLNFKIETTYSMLKIWDILIFMFLGMAFYKSGIITGNVSSKVYWILTCLGVILGGYLSWLYIAQHSNYQYNQFSIYKNTSFGFYEIARTFRSIGVLGIIMLIYKSGRFKWFFSLMKPVGQMAFTNYLTQSFICNFIFLGAGLGLIGSFDRKEIYFIAIGVWVIQIIWSHIWLRYYRYGPLEWCWRSLTYWKKQPMSKTHLD